MCYLFGMKKRIKKTKQKNPKKTTAVKFKMISSVPI